MVINPANRRGYPISEKKKDHTVVPPQIKAMMRKLELPDDFLDDL